VTRILGAVLAGGRSRRFGSDKALAMLGGMTLIEHAIAALAPQVDAMLVCGRSIDGMTSVADRPAPDLGPLGGVNAALCHAAANSFEAVVTIPCDMPLLPADLVARLRRAGAASFVAGMPVMGLWPASLAGLLDALLVEDGDRSMRGWAARAGALPVAVEGLVNVNTPADLRRLA
jgi:molybdopterin-guanine dinucleotide biosynthesis protein A